MPGFEFELEYAKSGRAACKQCKAKIEQGTLRIALKASSTGAEDPEGEAGERKRDHLSEAPKWHHADCFPRVRGPAWFRKHLAEAPDQVAGFEALSEEDRMRVVVLFAACRGEGTAPAAAAATPSSPSSSSKRKAEALEAAEKAPAKSGRAAKKAAVPPAPTAQGVLTEEEAKAIEEAKAELAKRNLAMLGTLLAKNGLPKTGRKEELLERVAECRVLGVPPLCSSCGKSKLKWSRETGCFSCPGFFDDATSRFQRCKGPGEGAELTRTSWQELGA